MLHIAGTETEVPPVLTARCLKPAWEHLCHAASNGYNRLSNLLSLLFLFKHSLISYKAWPTDGTWKYSICSKRNSRLIFFPHLLPREKKHAYFLCVMALCRTPPNTSPFFPLPWIIFSQGGEGMGWDGKKSVAFMFSSNDFVYNYFLLDFLLTVYETSLYFNNSIVATAALIIFP